MHAAVFPCGGVHQDHFRPAWPRDLLKIFATTFITVLDDIEEGLLTENPRTQNRSSSSAMVDIDRCDQRAEPNVGRSMSLLLGVMLRSTVLK